MNRSSPMQRIKSLALVAGFIAAYGLFIFPMIKGEWDPLREAVERFQASGAEDVEEVDPASSIAEIPPPAVAARGVFSHVSDPPTGVLRYSGPRHLASSEGQVIRTCLNETCTKGSDWSRKVVVDDGDMVQARAAVAGE